MSLTSIELARKSQRPYRYGMILLCVGALINWLGLAENYIEPVRYIGVACIIAGALLICSAMCCWLQRPATDPIEQSSSSDNHVHVIEVETMPQATQQKPPDYETVADSPPCYEEAIKLNPSLLLNESEATTSSSQSSLPCSTHLQSVVVGDRRRSLPIPATPPPPYDLARTAR